MTMLLQCQNCSHSDALVDIPGNERRILTYDGTKCPADDDIVQYQPNAVIEPTW